MFDLKLLEDKVIFDHSELIDLRAYYSKSHDTPSLGRISESALNEALSAHLNEHLRGIEFSIRQTLVKSIIQNYLLNEGVLRLSYFDVATQLLALNLPTKQLLKNLQGWILMSTEYALPEPDLINSLSHSDLMDFSAEPEPLTASSVENNPMMADDNLSVPEVLSTEPELPIAAMTSSPQTLLQTLAQWLNQYQSQFKYGLLIGLSGVILFAVVLKLDDRQLPSFNFRDACYMLHHVDSKPKALRASVTLVYETSKEGIPAYLSFNQTDVNRLKGYLKRNNSMLANEPYFSAILDASASMNVNPLLLFAITGQEQNFVKRGSENAALIVNNPFNVYHSWVDYNTNIKDSSAIAANTVYKQLAKRPATTDPFKWLNQIYAEDPKWHLGVEQIFLTLDSYCNLE